MEIRLSGKEALVIAGVTVMEAVIACVAIKKAVKAERKAGEQELKASIYEFSNFMNEERIKELEEENSKLKSGLKGEES